jgi:tetratricopeptide (TPR) repeat protein
VLLSLCSAFAPAPVWSAGKADKSAAKVVQSKETKPAAGSDLRTRLEQKQKELVTLHKQMLDLEIAYIKSMLARGEDAKAVSETKNFLQQQLSHLDANLARDRIKLDLPDIWVKMPSQVTADAQPQLTAAFGRWRVSSGSYRFGEEDATDLEKFLKQTISSSETIYGANSPQKLQALFDLCALYTNQMRRSEARTLLRELALIYSKLSSEQQHYFALSFLELAYTTVSNRMVLDAAALYRPVLTAISNSNWPFDQELNQRLSNIGSYLESQQSVDAEEVYRSALRMAEKSPNKDPVVIAAQQRRLADSLVKLKRFTAAEELYRMALESEEKRLGANNNLAIQSRIGLIKLCLEAGKTAEAQDYLGPLLKSTDSVDDAHSREFQRKLVDLASFFTKQGDADKAYEVLRAALSLGRRTKAITINDFNYQIEPLGRALINQGKTDQAMLLCEDFIKVSDEMGKGNTREFASVLHQALRLYLEHDLFERAAPLLKRRLELARSVESDRDYSYRLREFAEIYKNKDKLAEARELYEQMVAITPGDRESRTQNIQDRLVLMTLYGREKRDADARACALKIVEVLSPLLEKGSPVLKAEVEQLVRSEAAANRYESVQNVISNVLYSEPVRGSGTDVVNCLMNLAWHYSGNKDSTKATSLMRACVDMARKNYGERDPRTAQVLTRLSDQLHMEGKTDEANAVRLEADNIRNALLQKR